MKRNRKVVKLSMNSQLTLESLLANSDADQIRIFRTFAGAEEAAGGGDRLDSEVADRLQTILFAKGGQMCGVVETWTWRRDRVRAMSIPGVKLVKKPGDEKGEFSFKYSWQIDQANLPSEVKGTLKQLMRKGGIPSVHWPGWDRWNRRPAVYVDGGDVFIGRPRRA